MVTILSAHDNGDGTYDVTFSEPVTIDISHVGENDVALQLFSNMYGTWGPPTIMSTGTNATQTFASDFNSPGDSPLLVVLQPTLLTAAHAFQVVEPRTTVT